MNSTPQCSQKVLFALPTEVIQSPLVLELRGISVPPNKSRKDQVRKTDRIIPPNCHIPSFKNSKVVISKGPHGRPLERPFLITKPELAKWMEKAVRHLESTLLYMCQTESDVIPPERSTLSAMLSRLPEDDSVNDLTQGSWSVEMCEPGREGATITLTRLL